MSRIGSGFGIFKGAGSGGSALTIYSGDSSLISNRTVALAGYVLNFE